MFQFPSLEALTTAANLSKVRVPALQPTLIVKRKVYPIIIHGMNTRFNPDNVEHTNKLIRGNPEALSSAVACFWANPTSIKEAKSHSLLIFHLTNPNQANYAIQNSIVWESVLKRAEQSRKRVIQCFKCFGFDHVASKCSKPQVCSHCTDKHPVTNCPKADKPPTCVNCLRQVIEEGLTTDPDFSRADIPAAKLKSLSHAALSNTCPIRASNAKAVAENQATYYVTHNVE